MTTEININDVTVNFRIADNTAFANTRDIAKVFGKEHFHVIRSLKSLSIFDKLLNESKIESITYKDAKGEKRPMYNLDRDVFSLLIMGFTGEKALEWKLAYLKAFNTVLDKAYNIGKSLCTHITYSNKKHDFSFRGFSFSINMVEGEPWFLASEICDILGLKDISATLKTIPEDERGYTTLDTFGGNQVVDIIDEAGFYRLVFRSNRKEAEAFKTWVCKSVLPSIRKTGSYAIDTDEAYKRLLEEFKDRLINIQLPHIVEYKSVYIMEDGNGHFKIGVSKHPEERLRQLSCGNTQIVLVKQTELLEDAYKLESYLHNVFSAYRIQGEWFNCPVEQIKATLSKLGLGQE